MEAICSTVDTVYCVCKMINDRNKEMVKCLTCLNGSTEKVWMLIVQMKMLSQDGTAIIVMLA